MYFFKQSSKACAQDSAASRREHQHTSVPSINCLRLPRRVQACWRTATAARPGARRARGTRHEYNGETSCQRAQEHRPGRAARHEHIACRQGSGGRGFVGMVNRTRPVGRTPGKLEGHPGLSEETQNEAPGAPRGSQNELPKSFLDASGRLGAPGGLSKGAPGWSWALLGALRAVLGAVLGALGSLRGLPGARRGFIWASQGAPFGALWASVEGSLAKSRKPRKSLTA